MGNYKVHVLRVYEVMVSCGPDKVMQTAIAQGGGRLIKEKVGRIEVVREDIGVPKAAKKAVVPRKRARARK